MQIKVPYNALVEAVNTVSSALSGKAGSGSDLIFLADEEGLTLAGWTPVMHVRVSVPEADVLEINPDGVSMQLKLNQISSYLGTFSNLSRTKADWVEFSEEGVRLKMSVHEIPLDPDEVEFEQISPFYLEKLAVRDRTLQVLKEPFPEEEVTVDAQYLDLYLATLLPNLSDEQNEGVGSKLNFTEDWVFVISNIFASFMSNRLPEVFHNIELSYGSVSFLRKLCSSSEFIEVVKQTEGRGGYLDVRAGQVEAFLRYSPVRVPYEARLRHRTKDSGVLLDRGYLKDVLRRMEVSGGDNADIEVVENGLQISTENYSQTMPVQAIKGEVVGSQFKIPVRTFGKTILGRDGVFEGEVFLYLHDAGSSYALYLQDATDSWLSTLQVRKDRAATKVEKTSVVPAFISSKKGVKVEEGKVVSLDELVERNREVSLEDLQEEENSL